MITTLIRLIIREEIKQALLEREEESLHAWGGESSRAALKSYHAQKEEPDYKSLSGQK